MMKIAMSRPASALLRALLERAGADRNRILLTDWKSIDWQSLTFIGERHRIRLRIIGAGGADLARQLTDGIEEAEFPIPGHFVADIAVTGEPRPDDGGFTIQMEALTIAD